MLPIINFDSSNTFMSSDLARPKRRTAPKPGLDWFLCSQQSILTAMDRFVKSVNNMDSTVLVPSKLRDMELAHVSNSNANNNKMAMRIPMLLGRTDLHSFYLMLNDVKKELMWGPGNIASHEFMLASSASSQRIGSRVMINRSVSSVASSQDLKARRQTSDDSLGSSAASSISSDTESDADSMITDRDSIEDQTSHLAVAFRHHLQGLHAILHQLADSADYLSTRYQQDIENA